MAQNQFDKAFDKLDKDPFDEAFDKLDGKGRRRAEVDPEAFKPRSVSTNEFLTPEEPKTRDTNTRLDSALTTLSDFSKAALAAGLSTRTGRIGMNTLAFVGDILSRGNFAMAGSADEVLNFMPEGERAALRDAIDDPSLGRIFTAAYVVGKGTIEHPELTKIGMDAAKVRFAKEIFSGVGSVEGQKEDFSKVLTDLGVAEGGRASDSFLRGLYSDGNDSPTKQFFTPKVGGLFDPTKRGAIGLAGDIFLDPTTYLTGGVGGAVKTSAQTAAKTGVKAFSKAGVKALAKEATEELTTRGLREGTEKVGTKLVQLDKVTGKPKIKALKSAQVGADEIPDNIIRNTPNAKLVEEGTISSTKKGIKGAEPKFSLPGVDETLTASQLRHRLADQLGIDPEDVIVPVRGMKKGETIREYLLHGTIDKFDAPGLMTKLEGAAIQAAEERVAARILAGDVGLLERGGLKMFGQPIAFQKGIDKIDGKVKLYGKTRRAGRNAARKLEDTPFEPILNAGRASRDIVDSAYTTHIRPKFDLFKRDISNNPFFRSMKQDSINKWDNWLGSTFDRAKRTMVDPWKQAAKKMGSKKAKTDKGWSDVHELMKSPQTTTRTPEGALAKSARQELDNINRAEREMFPGIDQSPLDAALLGPTSAEIRNPSELVVPIYFREFKQDVIKTMRAIYDDLGISQMPTDTVVVGPFGRVNTNITADDLVRRSERLAKTNPDIKPLTQVKEPTELLTKRAKEFHGKAAKEDLLSRSRKEFNAAGNPAEKFDAYRRIQEFVDQPQLDPGHPLAKVIEDNFDPELDMTVLAAFAKTRLKNDPDAIADFVARTFKGKVRALDDIPEFLGHFGRYLEDFPGIKDLDGFTDDFGDKFVKRNYGQNGRSLWLADDIARDLDGMDRKFLTHPQLQSMLHRYDSFTRFVKTYLTAPFPAFHTRNGYGNVAQSFTDIGLSIFHPGSAKMTRNILGKEGGVGVNKNAVMRAENGIEYSARQIEQLVRRHDVLTDAEALFEFSEVAEQAARMGAPIRGIGSAEKSVAKDVASLGARPLARVGRKSAQTIENSSRVQLFTTYLRRGMRPEDAAARVDKFLFDYNNLSNFEKAWMKRLFTFYTFNRKNIPLQIENVFMRPGTTSVQLDLLRSNQEDRDDLAVFRHEGGLIKLGKDKETITILDGVDLPITGLNFLDPIISTVSSIAEGAAAITGNKVDINPIGADQTAKRNAEILGLLNPLIKTPIEVAIGKNAFGRRDIDRQKMSVLGQTLHKTTPQEFQDWLGLRSKRDRNGRLVWEMDQMKYKMIVEMWGVSRLVSTPDKVWRGWVDAVAEMQADGNESEGVDVFVQFLANVALDLGAGIRVEELNLSEEELFRANLRINDINELLSRQTGASTTVKIPAIKKEFKKTPKTIDQAFDDAFGE